jgi:hypothetical protein
MRDRERKRLQSEFIEIIAREAGEGALRAVGGRLGAPA